MMCIFYTRTDWRFEFMNPLVVCRVEAILFDKFPESFDSQYFSLVLDELAFLVTGIIQHQRDRPMPNRLGKFQQELANALRIDVTVIGDGQHFLGHRIQCPQYFETLAP